MERLITLGVNNYLVTTNFDQWMNLLPSEGMLMVIATILDAEMLPDEVSMLVKDNPMKILLKD